MKELVPCAPLAAIFLLGCYADVGENKIVFAGNQRTTANIKALKLKRYGTGLTQEYNWYGGSGNGLLSTSNTANHDNHEKINSWVSFTFLYGYGAPLGGTSVPLGPAKIKLKQLSVCKTPFVR